MREKRNHSVRSSVLQSREPRKKYFLVYEGIETEPIYFDALKTCTKYSRINPLIDMVPIIKGITKKGLSNPKRLIDGFLADLEASQAGSVTYNTLIDCIVENACPDQMSDKSLCNILKAICTSSLNIKDLDSAIPKGDINSICSKIEEESELVRLVETIPDIIKEYSSTFDSQYDCIGFIIDRDRDSFIAREGNNQYQYVLNKCIEKNFGFFITNPCFEYWLLLHFEEANDLDKELLLSNPKINANGEPSKNGKRYTERELKKLLPGYKKSCFKADLLMPKIDLAIQNEEAGCEDVQKLEYTVGSRIGILIQELRGCNE